MVPVVVSGKVRSKLVLERLALQSDLVGVQHLRFHRGLSVRDRVEQTGLEASVVRNVPEDIGRKLVIERETPCNLVEIC